MDTNAIPFRMRLLHFSAKPSLVGGYDLTLLTVIRFRGLQVVKYAESFVPESKRRVVDEQNRGVLNVNQRHVRYNRNTVLEILNPIDIRLNVDVLASKMYQLRFAMDTPLHPILIRTMWRREFF